MPKIYIHPLPIRVWHWINAVGFVIMLITGTQIRYVGVIDAMPFRTAVTVHNWTGFVLIANYSIWLLFYLCTDKITVYHPELNPVKHFRNSFRQLEYYGYGMFIGAPNPTRVNAYHKFNPLQSMTYSVVMMLLVPLSAVTGILLWDVAGFYGAVDLFGGIRVVDTVHVLVYIFFVFFILFHAYMATLDHSTWGHYKAMFITGYEDVED